MGLAFDSKAVDALVLYVAEEDGKPVYTTGKTTTNSINRQTKKKNASPLVAIQYQTAKTSKEISDFTPVKSKLSILEKRAKAKRLAKQAKQSSENVSSKVVSTSLNAIKTTAAIAPAIKNLSAPTTLPTISPKIVKKIALKSNEQQNKIQPGRKKRNPKAHTASSYIRAISEKPWEYAPLLDRYIVQYDKETYIVLTIRPTLQKKLDNILKKYSERIGVSVVQDPSTGAILAMNSSHKNNVLDIESKDFTKKHWALKATFPVASIFKIITASAGIDTRKFTPDTKFRAWKRSYLKVWQAFAKSHNAVFGKMARKVGYSMMKKYINAFGFNKKLFFDLPVGKSIAKLPKNSSKMGRAAAGLNRNFLISPMHVASIIGTVLNRGKMMKPYLVDYVVRKNKTVFRRRPFQIANPIKSRTAKKLYKMMHSTTTYGTGKRGFGGYRKAPNLAKLCGGKTGTLTGASPHYLFTWFGGFTKVTGRDLCIVTLMGQKNHSQTKASSVAGQIAYELYLGSRSDSQIASR